MVSHHPDALRGHIIPKRGNGEASYRERPNGLWEGRVTIPGLGRRSFYGALKRDVVEQVERARRDHKAGLDPTAKPETVAAFLARWLDESAVRRLRPRSIASYRQIVALYIVPAVGKHDLRKLTIRHVERMTAAMEDRGLSSRTAQYARAVLRRALKDAVRWGLVERNVAAEADAPRLTTREILPLSPDEVTRFLAGVRAAPDPADQRLWTFFALALYTGLRQGELSGLRWRSVDLQAGTLRVTHALQRVEGAWTFVEPKSRRSTRQLSLPAPAIAALRAQRDLQTFEQARAFDPWPDLDLVFTTPHGTPLDPSNVNRRLHLLLESCGLERRGMHALRHSCASALIAQGVHPRVVMEQLGHSQISLTMDTYGHVCRPPCGTRRTRSRRRSGRPIRGPDGTWLGYG